MLNGEFALIERIRRRASSLPAITLGIGDDCSALRVPPHHELLTSTDLLLENVHFRLDWTDMYSIGFKSVAVNVSDIAAMGAEPLSFHLAVGLPVHLTSQQIDLFLDGVFDALQKYRLSLAGGDTCRSEGPLMIAATVQGIAAQDRMVRRSGAQEGDDLWVSGSLGDSALALKRLQAGTALSKFLAQRHHRPEARVDLGQRLAKQGLVTAMLDLSDGLLGDLRHLLDESGVGARLELERLPLSAEFRTALSAQPELIDLALCGGEDYELLFSAAAQQRGALKVLAQELSLPLQRIGGLTSGSEIHIFRPDGELYTPQQAAFDHFRSQKDKVCE
ncbi:MAG: thiamine-phosphate kinase [Geopsychrobacter sp.]|nr:thiamine-phosphate kinase [Geopsychrobacter sp.]